MQNVRTLVVDVDDTISFHKDRDYTNASPNLPMIAKLNQLFDSGWDVVYFTARGQVSCDGDLELILETKHDVLANWMNKNGVKYTRLQFGKPIGFYYIDDKALRPDEFLNITYEKLEGGSGAIVERLGDRVLKKGENVDDQARWYDAARRMGLDVPVVHNCFGGTLDIEYVNGKTAYGNITEESFKLSILNSLRKFRSQGNILPYDNPTWETMVRRVKDHLKENSIRDEALFLSLIDSDRMHALMNLRTSFSHGDFTLSNMLIRENGSVCFIDPNSSADVFSSYLMDYGKLYQSIHHRYEEVYFNAEPLSNQSQLMKHIRESLSDEDYYAARLIEIIHYVRMLKYKPPVQRKLVQSTIQELLNEFTAEF